MNINPLQPLLLRDGRWCFLDDGVKKRVFSTIFGPALSILIGFSSRKGLIHQEKQGEKKHTKIRKPGKMPPKRTPLPMFEWAKKGGALTEHTRGIVFGLHLAGWSVPDIADRLGMSQQGVRQSVALSEKTVGGQRADEPERGPTTTSQKKGEIASRRRVVARLMRKRDRDGNYVVESSRDLQAALLDEGVQASRRTAVSDMHAVGGKYVSRPKTADLTARHMKRRVDAARDLLAAPAEKILFSDESLFNCSDMQRKQWVPKGEAPTPRRTATRSAQARV